MTIAKVTAESASPLIRTPGCYVSIQSLFLLNQFVTLSLNLFVLKLTTHLF